jgi:protein SCO1/2
MERGQKILTITLWAVAVLAMIGLVTTGVLAKRYSEMRKQSATNFDQPEERLPVLFDVPDFSFTDQNEKTLKRDDLKGHVWVGAFIFTNCPGVCPMMTGKMRALEDAITDPKVQLVSISLDPERDTPAVLKQYAAKMKADQSRWHFLTGDKTKIYNLAADMKVTAQPATQQLVEDEHGKKTIEDKPIVHSEKLILVDQTGHIRGYYSSTSDDDMKQLATDASDLASGKAPSVGA